MHAFRSPVPFLSSAGAPRRFKAAVASQSNTSVSAGGRRLRALRVECNELNKWCVLRVPTCVSSAPGASQDRGDLPTRG